MESKPAESVRAKMESLRLACDGEVVAQQQAMHALTAAIRNSLASVRATAEETVKSRGKVREVKSKLREAEDDLFKALAVKTRKEAKRMALMDAIVARKARIEEIRRAVRDQRDKRDGYAVILSQQFSESEEEDCNQISRDEVKEAVSWYNKVLGLNIEGGHGVRFTFKNISLKNPDKEFSFVVRHANDTYTLLDCVPHINETKDLIHDLNKTNGLFKFVRDMRLQFQEAAAEGLSSVLPQESSSISDSGPALSVSTERSESLAKIYEHQFQYEEVSRQFKKPNHGMGSQAAIFSPGSASSLHQSPCFKVKK